MPSTSHPGYLPGQLFKQPRQRTHAGAGHHIVGIHQAGHDVCARGRGWDGEIRLRAGPTYEWKSAQARMLHNSLHLATQPNLLQHRRCQPAPPEQARARARSMHAGVSYAQHCSRSAGRPRLRRYTARRDATPAAGKAGKQWWVGCRDVGRWTAGRDIITQLRSLVMTCGEAAGSISSGHQPLPASQQSRIH